VADDDVEADETAGLVPVGEWPSLAEAREHSLVVLAMNLECWIFPGGDRYAVHAEPEQVPVIRREFELYQAEQAERRERVDPPVFPAGMQLAVTWALVLLAVFLWQGRDPQITEQFLNSSRAMVSGGEWWRPFTALFLHGDAGHLLGNVFLGGIFCIMVSHSIGAWRGWALILAAGTLGNAVNAWLRFPADFTSLGASTATFGAVGVLVGTASVRAWRSRSYRELRPVLVPLVIGLVLLGWYGTGGEAATSGESNTDVAGHFAGWASGVLLAGAAAAFPDRPARRPQG
jgi:membrane associated rhomboid family serine protease